MPQIVGGGGIVNAWRNLRKSPNFMPFAVLIGGGTGLVGFYYWDNIKTWMANRGKKSDGN